MIVLLRHFFYFSKSVRRLRFCFHQSMLYIRPLSFFPLLCPRFLCSILFDIVHFSNVFISAAVALGGVSAYPNYARCIFVFTTVTTVIHFSTPPNHNIFLIRVSAEIVESVIYRLYCISFFRFWYARPPFSFDNFFVYFGLFQIFALGIVLF